MAYPLTVRKVPKAEIAQRVAKALAMVQLGGRDQAYPSQLSGGQQQRVALARALVFEPQLVLMDEPLGALDKQLREHMQIELKELHRQLGVTFVYVTHDQGEALTMSDRVAVFNDGAIQQIDAVERLYETPTNRFVAGFVGDSTQLTGTVGSADGPRCELVLPTGERLAGVNVNAAATGAAVVASVRPERIEAHLHGARGSGQRAAGLGRRRDLLRRPPAPALRRDRPGPGHRQAAARPRVRTPPPDRAYGCAFPRRRCASMRDARCRPLHSTTQEETAHEIPPPRWPAWPHCWRCRPSRRRS